MELAERVPDGTRRRDRLLYARVDLYPAMTEYRCGLDRSGFTVGLVSLPS